MGRRPYCKAYVLPGVFQWGTRPAYENIIILNLTCADPVDDDRNEITCVIECDK
jgi:hypothetical protein